MSLSSFFNIFTTDTAQMTLMERVCSSVHPDLGVGALCYKWFDQATSYCLDSVDIPRRSSDMGWWKFLKYIFTGNSYSLLSMRDAIPVNPDNLDSYTCNILLRSISEDFMRHAPQYTEQRIITFTLLELFIMIGVLLLLLMLTFYLGSKSNGLLRRLKLDPPLENILVSCFNVQDCIEARLRRSMRIMKYELRTLVVQRLLTPEDVYPIGNERSLIVFVRTKLAFLRGIVTAQTSAEGALLRTIIDENSKEDGVSPTTDRKIHEMVHFLNRHTRKLRVTIVFEDEQSFDDLLMKPLEKSPKTSPSRRPKSSPVWGKAVPKVSHEENKRFLAQFALSRTSRDNIHSSPELTSTPTVAPVSQNRARTQKNSKMVKSTEKMVAPKLQGSSRGSRQGRRK